MVIDPEKAQVVIDLNYHVGGYGPCLDSSVAIDLYAWLLFVAYKKTAQAAKMEIREKMGKRLITTSADANRHILNQIVKPEILAKHSKDEGKDQVL